MFYYLEGTVTHTEPFMAVIDCQGVGYACRTTLSTLSHLSKGSRARLYTYCHVREDLFDIYGFFDLEEKSCFTMLMGITGVGTKAALSLLSTLSPERLALAVLSEDERAFTAAQGIGKKLAQRMILELRDKMGKAVVKDVDNRLPVNYMETGNPSKQGEAQAALCVLGYSATEAAMALKGLDMEALTVEQLVREGLKKLSSL